jgi:hypothetical protein
MLTLSIWQYLLSKLNINQCRTNRESTYDVVATEAEVAVLGSHADASDLSTSTMVQQRES